MEQDDGYKRNGLGPENGIATPEQIDAVVDVLKGALGAGLVVVYLYGSGVVGGLKPASDLDFFAVIRKRSTARAKRQLVGRLRPVSDVRLRPVPWRPIELTVVALEDVRPWRYPPHMDFQHGEWLRTQFDAGELEPYEAESPDLAVLIAQVRETHLVLRGPQPAELLDAVPMGDLGRAMRDAVHGLLADADSDTTNVVLTRARIWLSLATGTFAPKDIAVAWAAERLAPKHRLVLERAKDIYLGFTEDGWDDRQSGVNAAIDALVTKIGTR